MSFGSKLQCSSVRPPSISSLHSLYLKTFQSGQHCPTACLASPGIRPHLCCSISEGSCLELLSLCNWRPQPQGVSCVHGPIIKLGLGGHLFLTNNLLSLYSRIRRFDLSRKLFDEMPHRDVVSWSAIISAYAQTGNHEEALALFAGMQLSGLIPNDFTFSSILRCASSLRASGLAACSHAQIIKHGFESNLILASALIDVYAKCHKFEHASQIFTLMVDKDAVSWTTMISAHVHAEDWSGGMHLYTSMIKRRISPNEFTFAKILQVCGFLGPHYGELVHAHVIVYGIELNLVLKTALVDMYSKSHRMAEALKVFSQTPEADVALWTALLSGYTQAEDYDAAIAAFQEMELAGVPPNSFTYAGVVSVCTAVPLPELGKQLHSRVIKVGLEHDVSVSNAFVDLYAKCSTNHGVLLRAFNIIISPNVISWTALIAGLARHGHDEEAFDAFTEMRVAGVQPNSFTLSTILRGCGSLQTLAHAEKIHAYVLKTGSEYSDMTIGNSLVDLYARFGRPYDAWKVTKEMPCRDVFTYTSLAKVLNHMGLHRMALDIITYMRDEDVKMDGFSIASFLSASAGLAAVDCGRQLHCYSVKSGLNSWISISNGLVDMYSKCGSVGEAHKVFMAIQGPNVVSWNGLISGLASNGHFLEALSAFEDMRLAGAQPDGITFLLVLYACSHGGLTDLGVEYFHSMSEAFGMVPQLDHYVCLVDLLGRAGRLDAAASAIESMPFRPDALVYKTLLSACRLHGNLALGEHTARHALEMEPSDPAIYVLLAGMYYDAGRPDLGALTRRVMRERGSRKYPGQSWMMMPIRS